MKILQLTNIIPNNDKVEWIMFIDVIGGILETKISILQAKKLIKYMKLETKDISNPFFTKVVYIPILNE